MSTWYRGSSRHSPVHPLPARGATLLDSKSHWGAIASSDSILVQDPMGPDCCVTSSECCVSWSGNQKQRRMTHSAHPRCARHLHTFRLFVQHSMSPHINFCANHCIFKFQDGENIYPARKKMIENLCTFVYSVCLLQNETRAPKRGTSLLNVTRSIVEPSCC